MIDPPGSSLVRAVDLHQSHRRCRWVGLLASSRFFTGVVDYQQVEPVASERAPTLTVIIPHLWSTAIGQP